MLQLALRGGGMRWWTGRERGARRRAELAGGGRAPVLGQTPTAPGVGCVPSSSPLGVPGTWGLAPGR